MLYFFDNRIVSAPQSRRAGSALEILRPSDCEAAAARRVLDMMDAGGIVGPESPPPCAWGAASTTRGLQGIQEGTWLALQ
eukprot:Transcript_31824.p4 GENE.Transcript_31824~~Transcript_31824.p4  ORF type:complete len:80 (+),score=6.79 Transcript_31824:53-292(+)